MLERLQLISVMSRLLALALICAAAQPALSKQRRPRQVSRPPVGSSWTVPADTIISLRLDRSLSSKTSRVGDRFTATVTIPVHVNGLEVIPAGSVVEGRVTEVTPAKRMSRSGTIAIDFDDLILPDGLRIPIEGELTSDDPETRERIDDESRVSGKSQKKPAVFVGGGGAIGAVLGGIAGGGKGAVLGGIVGAGAGVAGVLLSKGEEAQVPAGTPFGIQLTQPLVFRDTSVARNDPQPRSDRPRYADPDSDRGAEPAGRSAESSEPVRAEENPVPTRPEDNTEPARTADPPSADPPAASEPLPLSSPEMIRRAQHALRDNGYYEGVIDGKMSPRVSNSLKTYQRENKLPETGELDEATAKSLGILGGSTGGGIPAREASAREPARDARPATNPATNSVLATVLSANANRGADGSIYVMITTQAPTGGWRWFGDSVVNGDTLEVYARAIKLAGMATQAITRGRIEMTVRDGVQYVRRVVVHGAGGNINIPLGARAGSPQPGSAQPGRPDPSASPSINQKAEQLLADYQRLIGVRLTAAGVEFESGSRAGEPEIELLFAIDNFANASRLYQRLTASLRGQSSLRSATLALAKEARRLDRVVTTTSSPTARQIERSWDSVRQDVLKLMRANNIDASEIED